MSLLRACGRVLYGSLLSPLPTGFLRPGAASLGATRLMKVVSAIRKRCENCYITKRGRISYVQCKAHPRHKQRQGSKNRKVNKK
mmetsp:Transcript_40119/g.90940  ORF Transcript_40119/g.90940 Transcript_40119/m.90940 type:complete len:84 (-) Transcript_40119:360-611(-)